MSEGRWGIKCWSGVLLKDTQAHGCRRTRETEDDDDAGRRKRDMKEKIQRGKKMDRAVCVLVGGNFRDHLPLKPLPGPSQKPQGVPGFLRKNISAPHHPWTRRWAVYLGLAAWQLYWCYIQAHGDPESGREWWWWGGGGTKRRVGWTEKEGAGM